MPKRTKKAPPRKPKPEHPSTKQRVQRCYELGLEGYTANDVHRLVADNVRKAALKEEHDASLLWMCAGQMVSDRMVRRYMAKANERLELVWALKREQALGKSIVRRERLYRLAVDLGMPNTANRVQDALDRLNGLTESFNPGGKNMDKPTGIRLPDGQTVYL